MVPHPDTPRRWLMSLRAKLILLFITLAVVPLTALGAFDYVHSVSALDALIASQTQAIAGRAAAEITDRYSLRESDLLLLADNAETQQWYRAHATGDPARYAAALADASAYLKQAWAGVSRSYQQVEFLDTAGTVLYRLGGESAEPMIPGLARAGSEVRLTMREPVPGASGQRPLGLVIAVVRPEALLPAEALATRFGRSGYTVVVDRSGGRVISHPLRAFLGSPSAALLGPRGWRVSPALLDRDHGAFTFRDGDTTRVAAFVSLADPPWTVITTGAEGEFAPPFLHTRLTNLLLVLLVTAVTAAAFVLLTRRATRSLTALTAAADQVGAGNFSPSLPPAGHDEVGRLTTAFGLMASRLRDMVHEIEVSRHMVVVGQFAAQLSHEIRNPLTSLKLNLQSIGRDAEAAALPPATLRPIQISLREIERLDRVARGALRLGRQAPLEKVPCRLHVVAREALELVRPQLEQQHVALAATLAAPDDLVRADPAALQAVILNLLLNAVEAMPGGGTLSVGSAPAPPSERAAPAIRLWVGDTGPGVPHDLRERIFDPFYSTKPQGTGFGLPVALRTIEEHGGRLTLEAVEQGGSGATFTVELPLAEPGAAR